MATEYFSPSGTSISDSTVGIIDDPNFTIYVSLTAGNDTTGKGTLAKPFKSPHRAMFYLQNHFITENGFATIKCAAGRYTFNKPIEVRHPQGARIGIRGEETKDYILAKCSRWRSSHSNLGADGTATPADGAATSTLNTLHGTSACRFYEAGVHLNPIDWESAAVGNKIDPSDASGKKGIGVENGVSGDYVLVRDVTFAHKDNYDTVHEDWGADGQVAATGVANTESSSFKNKQSTRRVALLGAHIISSNIEEDTVNGLGGVNYICKYYNYPTMFDFASSSYTSKVSEDIDGTRPLWFGGYAAGDYAESAEWLEWDIPSAHGDVDGGSIHPPHHGQGDYYSGPFPPINCIQLNDFLPTGTYPTRFGNTAEGWTTDPTDGTIVVPTEDFYSFGETTHADKQLKMLDMRPSENYHMSLNRLELTHVRTIFEFTDAEKGGIEIDGGDFGFIQDLVLEGKWQQFNKHHNGLSGGIANTSGDFINEDGKNRSLHSGIRISNNGSLSYNLGKTGGSASETRYSRYRTRKPYGTDITISNVGINGFNMGVEVTEKSEANLNDIVISNCEYGININAGSRGLADRSVVTGVERVCNNANYNSSLESRRSIAGFGGCPVVNLMLNNNWTEGNDNWIAGYRDSSFKSGDVVALVDTNQDGHVGETVGIVRNWTPNSGQPGYANLVLYDHLCKWRIQYDTDMGDLVYDCNAQGLTLGIESKDSTSTIAADTHPSEGSLDFNTSSNSAFGNGFNASSSSSIQAAQSLSGNFGHACFSSYRNSHVHVSRCLAHNALMGYRTQWGEIEAVDSKAMNMSSSGFDASYGGILQARNSIAENVTYGWNVNWDSLGYTPFVHWIEGRTRHIQNVFSVTNNSSHSFSSPWITVNANEGGTDGWTIHNEDLHDGTNLTESTRFMNILLENHSNSHVSGF